MATTALTPVMTGLFTLLNVASLTAASPTGAGCIGGVRDRVPQPPVFPFLLYSLTERDLSGLGQGQATKHMQLRLQVFSQFPSSLEENRIMAQAILLLQFQTFTVGGWHVPAIGRPNEVVPVAWSEINGVVVRELVSIWDHVYADEVV